MSEPEVDKVVDTLGKFAKQASRTFREKKTAEKEVASWDTGQSWFDIDEEHRRAQNNAELFTFEPSEFQIIEEIDYDETIQRPEEIRFYTLQEQVADAFEKMVPKGRTTKFQLDVLKKETDRLKDLYETHIVPTAETYVLREPEYGKKFSWINPVYASAELAPYSFDESWIPLYSEERIRLANFYRSMLTALPKPYQTEANGTPYDLQVPTQFVDSDGKNSVRALPTFQYTRTQRHEDGRFDILSVPMANTSDSVHFVGYYAKKRPVPVPNPLPDHPFLQSSDPVMVESTAPLSEVIPSLDAILTHAVPVTADPYGEGMKYLRVYDVKLSDIPWNSWKSRFPPVEQAPPKAEPQPVDFPKPHGDKPSANLMKYYDEYFPAMSSRQWLMEQLDGGELVVHMLMSQAGQNGTVAISLGADAEFEFPKTTIAECDLMGLDFHDFSIRGTLRRTWGAKDKMIYQCVPLELIKQERKREGYRGRKQWTEKTSTLILEDYVKALVNARPVQPKPEKEAKVPVTPARELSELRHQVVAILGDKARFPEDKLRDVSDLVKDAVLTDLTYVDSKGLFLVCSHTLALLAGDLATDKRAFYDKWTARVDGFRVCKSCGEQINSDVLVDQEEFTDEGRLIRHADMLESSRPRAHAPGNTMEAIQSLFDLSVPWQEVFFMLISLLHVMPEIEPLQQMISMGTTLAGNLDKAKVDSGVTGIVQMILLIQTHVPPLVPRRSFGSKPLTLRGYPRDADKPEGFTIIDSMILVLTKTLEAYPKSFKGSSAKTMRSVLSTPSKIKTLVEKSIGTLLKSPTYGPALKSAFESAKAVVPAEEPMKPNAMIPGDVMMPAKDLFGSVKSPPRCPSDRMYWTSARPPHIKQPDVPLRTGINHFERQGSVEMKLVEPPVSGRENPVTIPVKDKSVIARLKLGKDGASDDWHTNVLIATRLASVFLKESPVKTLDPTQKNDDLRDITKGYVFELMSEINKDARSKTKLNEMKKNDLTLMMLTADVKRAAEVTNTLKAKERITFTERFRLMTDADREISKELVDRGLAPYIITKQDRVVFAQQVAEQEQARDEEVGVGLPVGAEEQQAEFPVTEDAAERGNYGDLAAEPNGGGHDYEEPPFDYDEEERP